MNRIALSFSLLLVAALTMGVDACESDNGTGSGAPCTVDGRVFEDGTSSVPAGDGCNTCFCEDGELTGCTEIACEPDGSCRVAGMTYPDGATDVPAPDGCNTCSCEDGELTACTEIACEPPDSSCIVGGIAYPDGASDVPAPDGCNTCSCEDGELTACTEIACGPNDTACTVFGQSYPGDWAPAPDSCNTCLCEDGMIRDGCTKIACAPAEIVPCNSLSPFESDPFDLESVSVNGDLLEVDVAYSGGCQPHYFRLCYAGFLESSPVETNLRLQHDGQGDPCEAYPSETRVFDLSPLKADYRSSYGTDSGTIRLRLGDGADYSF